jgi:hypothetical protein
MYDSEEAHGRNGISILQLMNSMISLTFSCWHNIYSVTVRITSILLEAKIEIFLRINERKYFIWKLLVILTSNFLKNYSHNNGFPCIILHYLKKCIKTYEIGAIIMPLYSLFYIIGYMGGTFVLQFGSITDDFFLIGSYIWTW